MATRSTDVNRVFEFNADKVVGDIPMIASDTIYAGSMVGESSSTGNARPLVAGDSFLGFAVAQATNGSTIGETNVRVYQRGIVKMDVTNVTADDDFGIAVYASDDDTLTTASTSNSAVGKIVRWISGTSCMVYFESAVLRSI